MIKAIIFDWGGVIGKDLSPSIYSDMSKINRMSPELMKESIKEEQKLFQTGKIVDVEFWKRIGSKLCIEPKTVENIWINAFKEKAKIDSDVENIITDLNAKGYKLAILSNMIKPFGRSNGEKRFYKLFSAVIFSHEAGMRKPDEEIYIHASEKLGVEPDECIFIDDKERNLLPAEKIGMKTILFKNAEQLKKDLSRIL